MPDETETVEIEISKTDIGYFYSFMPDDPNTYAGPFGSEEEAQEAANEELAETIAKEVLNQLTN